jgi:hypothetical protein
MPSFSTRVRAWALRTFKGRTQAEAAWEDESTWVSSPPQTFEVGALVVAASPLGVKAAGANRPSAVYQVTIHVEGRSAKWSSRYGLPATDNSARQAAEAALDELDQLWRDPDGWRRQVLDGMSEDEVEAMEDSPSMRLDLQASRWVGPQLDAVRGQRETTGSWLVEPQ